MAGSFLTIRERAISRERAEYLVRNLPRLIRVHTPPSVQEEDWFRRSGVEDILQVYALPCYQIDKFSGKLMAAKGNCDAFEAAGKFDSHPIVIVPTSGNFGKDVAGLARGYLIREVWAVLNTPTSLGKTWQVKMAGAKPFGVPCGVSPLRWAYELAEQTNCIVMNQYIEEGSIAGQFPMASHIATEMWRLHGIAGFMVGAVTGTGSTLMGMRRYLPQLASGPVKIFGVASASKKEKVPGSRSPEDYEELRSINGIPGFMFRKEWGNVLDFDLVADITRHQAYEINGELFRHHYSVGPTGALLTAGFYSLLRKCYERNELEKLQNREGRISVVLDWVDSHYAYDDIDYRRYLIV